MPMRRGRGLLPPLILALLATCLCFVGCGPSRQQQPTLIVPEVTVGHPVEIDFVDTYVFEGYTAAVESVDVRARVTGYLQKVFFQDGADVKEGDRLFQIDPRVYQAQLEQAQAALGRVEAQVKRLDADLARAERLLPNRNISKEDYDRIAADRAEAIADASQRKAAIDEAALNLDFCDIRAPISGRISRTLVTVGNLVTANMTHLTTIVSVDPVYAYFDVDEPTVLRIQELIREGKVMSAREGNVKIYMALDIDQGFPYEGRIDFIENRIDPKTGTLKIRGVFPNHNQALSPGLHVRIKVPIGKPRKVLAVPERAIASSQGNKLVYIVNDKNEVVDRPVTLGPQQDQLRIITSGVEVSDRVIINGLQRVRPGIEVKPKPAADSATATAMSAAAATP